MKKSNIGAIIRKEFNRFFTDRRLVMTAIILPGLMIYLLYSFMGSAMSDMYSVEDDFAPTVYAVNAPASIAALAQEAGMTLTDVSPQEAEGVRAQIVDKQAELLAVFPADFDAQVGLAFLVEENGRAAVEQAQYVGHVLHKTRLRGKNADGHSW